MASDKVEYNNILTLISKFAVHYSIFTRKTADYLKNIRDLSAYCNRMGEDYENLYH